ncbi:TIGR04076 family protein [Chloroflexota bacterium]
MAETYEVVVKVISQKDTCAAEHKVGDQWVIESKTPEGICLSALNALFPSLRVLRFGGSFHWSTDPDVATAACPDAQNPVIFELSRLRK